MVCYKDLRGLFIHTVLSCGCLVDLLPAQMFDVIVILLRTIIPFSI
jgi:hypothetical protein